MAQISTSAARVIDPVLTTAARGYKNSMFVGNMLFPLVAVAQRAGRVLQFGKESFRSYVTQRAPGQNVARIQYGYASNPYALADHALAGIVPIELLQEAAAVPGVDLGVGAIQMVQDVIGLRQEIEQATLARNAALYGGQTITLSGTTQFSDFVNSDPFGVLQTAITTIRQKVGLRPNTVVFGAAVWDILKFHPKLTDRFKYTGRDSITLEMMGNLLEVKQCARGDAVSASGAADALSDVWGKDIVLAYTQISGVANWGLPSYGYTYELAGYPAAMEPYYDRDTLSWVYPYVDAVAAQLVGAEAGYLIKNAVA